MVAEMDKILRDNYACTSFHTHVSMIQPRGRFNIDRSIFDEFWETYCEYFDENKKPIVGLAEKAQDYLPVLVDLDIKLKESDDVCFGDKIYTDKHIKQVIDIYQSVLRSSVQNCKDDHLICILLEKPLYRIIKHGNTYVKNGFHLHFPNLFLSKVNQEVHIIPRVQEKLREYRTFEDIGFEDSAKVIDTSCCNVPWLMYGSRKEEKMDSYTISKVIDCEGKEMDLENTFKDYRIFDRNEQLIKVAGNVKKYLPRILSIIPYGRDIQEVKPTLVSPLKIKEEKPVVKKRTYDELSMTETLKIAQQLLPMLADFRATERNEWMNIGWVLHNISDGSPEGLELWCEFSSRDDETYDEDTCIFEWSKMENNSKMSIGTLKHFAKMDNPQAYSEYIKKNVKHHMEQSLDGSHNDVAKVLYAEYGDEFVCSSITNKCWYQFVNHKWEEIEEGIFLREKISTKIAIKYSDIASELFRKLSMSDDKSEQSHLDSRIKLVKKIIMNLKSSPYKNNVMREAMEVFYDKNFREKLDKDTHLIAWKNGVYDLRNNIFRDGRPEDYISKALPIEYKEFDETDDAVLDVYNFVEKVFPDKSIRNYFMDISSEVFTGGNNRKQIYFWTGDGDNGKTVTQTIFEKMLGELSIKFNTTLITGKKTSTGSANPELARAGNGVRWAVLEEPDGDEQINIGTMKSLSGNDSYWARDLFEKGKSTREIIPMFKLIFICNKLPKLKYSDQATWNRIRVIPFESTFVRPGNPCPETYEEQLREKRFPMDPNFSNKIPSMIQAFAWVLLEHRKMVKTSVEDPAKVTDATAVYRCQNDVYRQFIDECVIEDKYIISLTELYSSFKEWYREGFPNQTVPIKNELKEYFEKVWGQPKSGCRWQGYRIRTLQDNEIEDEIEIQEDGDDIEIEIENSDEILPL